MHTTSARLLTGTMLVGVLTLGNAVTAPRAVAQPTNADRDASATLAQDGATSFSSSVDVPAPDDGLPVFAHYLPSLPVSLDNEPASGDYYSRNYLNPAGEGGKFSYAGGFLRDRPMPRQVLEGDWEQQDLRREVKDAADAGVTGFAVDVLETQGKNWERVNGLLQAATDQDSRFKILLQPDMTSQTGTLSPIDLAQKMSQLASSAAVYRSGSGRVVISPFAAERQSPDYWAQFNAAMASLGQPVDLLPIFVDVGDNIERFAKVSYGMGEWGSRTSSVVDASPDYAARAHALGKLWVNPVAVQDVRPLSGTFMEADNMATLRSTWAKAMRTQSDMALMVTWNDYSESSQMAPSVDHGYSLLSLNSYYLAQFRRRATPEIVRDAAYLSYRVQPAGAVPSQQSLVTRLSSIEDTPARDDVEIETILTAPAEVAYYTGGQWHYHSAPAGVDTFTAPLGDGIVRLVVTRAGQTLVAEQSNQDVSSQIGVQDLAYHLIGQSVR